MSSEARSRVGGLSAFEQLRRAREIIRTEGEAVVRLAKTLPTAFSEAVELLVGCCGCVIVTGIGKAGLIGQKVAATLASTGTRSHFLHPAEAVHGDLGRVSPSDCLLVFSASGETAEVVRLLPPVLQWDVPVVAVTCREDSTLAQAATVKLPLGKMVEAGALGLAPTTSTTAMLALGDALALVASEQRGFGRADFAAFHPGGSLGRRLAIVDDQMRHLDQCRLAPAQTTVRQVFIDCSRPGRRSGAILLHDESGQLVGLFTDSDLARLLECRQDQALDGPIAQVMTQHPVTVQQGSSLADAVELLSSRKLSELPVVDQDGRPAGLLDVTDLVEYAAVPGRGA